MSETKSRANNLKPGDNYRLSGSICALWVDALADRANPRVEAIAAIAQLGQAARRRLSRVVSERLCAAARQRRVAARILKYENTTAEERASAEALDSEAAISVRMAKRLIEYGRIAAGRANLLAEVA